MLAFGRAYCDCGKTGCASYLSSDKKFDELCKSVGVPRPCPVATEPSGRLAGTEESGLRVSPFSVSRIVGFESLLSKMFVAAQSLASENKETFWVPVDNSFAPRNVFEMMARKIFDYHCSSLNNGVIPHPELSGAEWWVQVKPAHSDADASSPLASASISTPSSAPKPRSAGIDLHYDKDERAAEMFGVGLFPQISTVTYLACDEAEDLCPTVILNNVISTPIGQPLDRVYVSYPAPCKHVSFDGRYLHGAPDCTALRRTGTTTTTTTPSSASPSSSSSVTASTPSSHLRITFLVNIWLNHRPLGVSPLPEDLSAMVNRVVPLDSAALRSDSVQLFPDSEAVPTLRVSKRDAEDEDYGEWIRLPFVTDDSTWGKDDDETTLCVRMLMPHSVDERLRQKKEQMSGASASGSGSSKRKKVLASDLCGSYELRYAHPDCCAYLDYEGDAEDEVADDVEEMVFCSEITPS